MSYCAYLRKSRADIEAEARGEGETLSRHKKILEELSLKLKKPIKNYYTEIVSGETIAARPIMQHLLSEVESGLWQGVFVVEVERLARGNTIDQGIVAQTFKFSNTEIITPMKTYNPNNEFDEEYFEFGLFMSRREYKTINRRLQSGRLSSVKEGKYVANQPPYGYNRVKIENDKGFTLEPNDEEAKIIKLIFELYTVGELQDDGSYNRLGTGLIANKLNSMNIPPKKGTHWVIPSIRDILINPVYIGKIRWNWRPASKKMINGEIKIERPRSSGDKCVIVNGLHPAIIDERTFELAQSFMKNNRPNPVSKNHTVMNPLAGIVVCGKCGRKMVRRPYNAKRKCPDTLMCPDKYCKNVSSALYYVEDRILKSLENWLSEYKIVCSKKTDEKSLTQLKIKKEAVLKLEKEIEATKKQINKLHDLLEQGIYSIETFVERSNINNEKLKRLLNDKLVLQKDITEESNKKENKKVMIPKIEKLLEVYNKLPSPKQKNDMLKEILEKVVYTKDKGGRWHNAPDDFEIVLYPKIPNSGSI